MYKRIKMLDLALDGPLEPLEDLEGYEALRVLVWLHGEPLGHVDVPLLPKTPYSAADLRRVLFRRLTWPILRHHLSDLISSPLPPEGVDIDELLKTPHHTNKSEYTEGTDPLVTVAVCTHDRTKDLESCLKSLADLNYSNLDVLVIDNAPSSDATEHLVKSSYPEVRYIREPRLGLNWARNRAVLEARGEIIAYTDDDVVVDPGWVSALAAMLRSDSRVMMVTGLTVPYELETEPQVLFERSGGFGRGYFRRYWRATRLGAGQCGAGANMAIRRSVFEQVGYFDPALDAGTLTGTGGDTEMFFRILKEGHTLVYEPAALVRHRHRREYAQLRKQLAHNSLGTFSYLYRVALAYPDLRLRVVLFAAWWFWRGYIRRLLGSFVRSPKLPRELILTELRYCLLALGRYPKASRVAESIATSIPYPKVPLSKPPSPRNSTVPVTRSIGVRTLDLGRPLCELRGVSAHTAVRLFVMCHGAPLGFVDIPNKGQPVGTLWLRDAIADQLNLRLLRRDPEQTLQGHWIKAQNALDNHYLSGSDKGTERGARLPDSVSVSIVVPTYDRPQDLRKCLESLAAQATERPFEIIVVDNNPVSGLTPPVVAEFPKVMLVFEIRRGRSYASNRGFAAASGEIIASIDDDMVASSDWLEKLIAPLVRPEVTAVTGNTLPFELDTQAQRIFEEHFGFWRGIDRWDADSEWFKCFHHGAVRTPLLGGTGNVAFRANILAHPQVGLMEEALGAGMTGTGEDTYLFYRLLRAGFVIAFEPSAYAWHKHRRSMHALRDQIYGYSRGHIAYQLVTLLRDRDLRVIWELGLRIPHWNLMLLARYAKSRWLGRPDYYPLRLILTQIGGYLAGPWSLLRSYRRVKREGRSDPYVPVYQRPLPQETLQSARDTQWS